MSDSLYKILGIDNEGVVSVLLEYDLSDGEAEIENVDSDESWFLDEGGNLINEEPYPGMLIEKKTYIDIGNGFYSLSLEQYIDSSGNIVSQEQKRLRYDNGDNVLIDQSDVDISLMGGDDSCEIIGGSGNFVNGNNGKDLLEINGGLGRYLGGGGADSIEVITADSGTKVNGNRGKDNIIGGGDEVIFRGGSEDDTLRVSNGICYGDLGSDVFYGLGGDGFADIQDFNLEEDFLSVIAGGNFEATEDGLTYSIGDDIHLRLAGITSTDGIRFVI